MWHASVAIRSPITGRPLARVLWSPSEVVVATALLRELLDGVGSGVTKVASVDPALMANGVALHAKRVLSEAEQARLDPAWCALPPVDSAGDGPMETVQW